MMQKNAIALAKMLSLPHLIIIFLVALIVFGPEKLPELARTFGKAMSEFKRATGDLRAGFEEQMRELEREAKLKEAQKQPAAESNTILPPPASTEPVSESATSPGPSASESAIHETVPQKASDGQL